MENFDLVKLIIYIYINPRFVINNDIINEG